MKKYHKTWIESKHRNTACVDCHYAPGQQHTFTAKFKGLSQLFSYLATPAGVVRKRAHIDDKSCTTSACHPLEEKFTKKRIKYTKTVSYVHQTHFDKTIEGQELHCATCHQHRRSKDHFTVSRDTCYLCHFKNVKFNTGRGKCEMCHELTDKPLQKQFESGSPPTDIKPITHQLLEKAGVTCESCHIELIRGKGAVMFDSCLDCHEEDILVKAKDKKLMHEKHVAGQEADCHNCHTAIAHKETEDILELVRSECRFCHPEHHLFQKALLTGEKLEDISPTPALMMAVRTNCLACHTKAESDHKGQKILRGSPQACVACHTEEHDKMLADWKLTIKKQMGEAREVEAEALAAIGKAKGVASDEAVAEAESMLLKGQGFLQIIEHGHGVHNKKYSLMLIDEALNNFEDIIDDLKTEQ